MTETKEQNSQYFGAAEHYIAIDGKPVSIKSEGYSGIEKTEDGYYNQRYWMNIGELDPGTYTIITLVEISEPVFDGWDWYGLDSDYTFMENYCTLTISNDTQAPVDLGTEAPADEEIESPTVNNTCDISSSIHSDWDTCLCETYDSGSILWTGIEEKQPPAWKTANACWKTPPR